MAMLLTHRGPDEGGSFVGERIGLAMRRLAIIDLATGTQPMRSDDGSVVLVFNGEIYNYKELRAELQELGDVFSTTSDTEVVLRAYLRYGDSFVARLRGMFAIAIWNEEKNELVLFRDRIGEKPLFYTHLPGSFVFGSEIKSLLPVVADRRVNRAAIGEFVSFGFLSGDQTMFDAIRKLPAGCMARISNEGCRISRYWAPSYISVDADLGKTKTDLRTELEHATQLNLRSDVEVGSFLSGGLDSSLITAMASRLIPRVKTFSIGYSGEAQGFNELHHARKVAEYLGTDHHEIIVSPRSNIERLPELIWHYDEPHGEPTSVLVDALCGEVAKHVKVAISGTGADELFLGYPRHKGSRYLSHYRKLPRAARSFVGRAFLNVSRESTSGSRFAKRVRKFLSGAEKSDLEAALSWAANGESDVISSLLLKQHPDDVFFESALGDGASTEDWICDASVPEISDMSQFDLQAYLPEYQLAYIDRMSMANSLEVRSPFCDYKIVEFAMALPANHKLRHGESKFILKEIAEDFLPDGIARRPKVGFDSPIGQWFKTELKEFVTEFLSPAQIEISGLLNPRGVESVLATHFSGKKDYSLLIWSIVSLEMWFRIYIELGVTDKSDIRTSEIRGFTH